LRPSWGSPNRAPIVLDPSPPSYGEIYILPLLAGLAVVAQRAWVGAVVAVAGLGLLHAGLARDIMSQSGREVASARAASAPPTS